MIYAFMVLVWFLFQLKEGYISPTSAHLPEVVDVATLHTLHAIGWESSGRIA